MPNYQKALFKSPRRQNSCAFVAKAWRRVLAYSRPPDQGATWHGVMSSYAPSRRWRESRKHRQPRGEDLLMCVSVSGDGTSPPGPLRLSLVVVAGFLFRHHRLTLSRVDATVQHVGQDPSFCRRARMRSSLAGRLFNAETALIRARKI